jgi:hypothetical protein
MCGGLAARRAANREEAEMIRVVIANELQNAAAEIHEAYVQAELDIERVNRSLDYIGHTASSTPKACHPLVEPFPVAATGWGWSPSWFL